MEMIAFDAFLKSSKQKLQITIWIEDKDEYGIHSHAYAHFVETDSLLSKNYKSFEDWRELEDSVLAEVRRFEPDLHEVAEEHLEGNLSPLVHIFKTYSVVPD